MDLSQIPALTPPPGVIPNFVHPQNEAYIPVVVISICFTLLVFFVSLRFYAKIWVLHAFGWDDGNLKPSSSLYQVANRCKSHAPLQR